MLVVVVIDTVDLLPSVSVVALRWPQYDAYGYLFCYLIPPSY